jgi:hypothetical protein
MLEEGSVVKLPDEILEAIFKSLASLFSLLRTAEDPPKPPTRRLNAIYALRPVCWRWRSVIDRAVHLHITYVRIPITLSGVQASTFEVIPSQQSEIWGKGGSSLIVDIYHSTPLQDHSLTSEFVNHVIEKLSLLKVHARRLLELHVRLPLVLYETLEDTINSLAYLPRLEHIGLIALDCMPTGHMAPINIGHAPRLASLRIVGPPTPTPTLLYIKSLHFSFKITTPEPWFAVVRCMEKFEFLESLNLKLKFDGDQEAYDAATNQSFLVDSVALARLKSLDLTTNSCPPCSIFFGSFAFQGLTRLSLILGDIRQCRIRSHVQFPQLPNLQTLVCEIWTWCQEVELFLEKSLPLNLKNLVFTIENGLQEGEEVGEERIRMPHVENLVFYSPTYPTWEVLARKLSFPSIKKLEMDGQQTCDSVTEAAERVMSLWDKNSSALCQAESFHFFDLGPFGMDWFMHSFKVLGSNTNSPRPKLRKFCQVRPASHHQKLEVFPRPREVTDRVPEIYGYLEEVNVVVDMTKVAESAENPLLLWKNVQSLVACLTWKQPRKRRVWSSNPRKLEHHRCQNVGDEYDREIMAPPAVQMLLALCDPNLLRDLKYLEVVIHFQERTWEATGQLPSIMDDCQGILRRIVNVRLNKSSLKSCGLSYIWGESMGIEDRVSVWAFG